MHNAEVTVILDSVSVDGKRITTFQLRYWRGIHAELMTHRALSKCAGSSRARPSQGIINQVNDDPWGPLSWGKNQPGMQAAEELTGDELAQAKSNWAILAKQAAQGAQIMLNNGLHKQIVNRILEPYTFIDVVLTGTEFNNFFMLRDHDAADPTIRDLAVRMKAARDESTPRVLGLNDWHLPYIQARDRELVAAHLEGTATKAEVTDLLIKISVARCARVSYKAFDGTVSPIEKDLELYQRLVVDTPLHATPAEHQAKPDFLIGEGLWSHPKEHGNFIGWRQYRKMLPNEYVPG